jgi:predicted transcriptional regulator of viral defense system
MDTTNMREKARNLEGWVEARQARGLYFFTREEALIGLGLSSVAFKLAAQRMSRRGRVARIRSGFFAIVPTEYSLTGVIPAEWFVNDFMAYLQRPFYVGILSAAALHGAAHQKPQKYHLVTDRPLREAGHGRLGILFFVKKNLTRTPTVRIKVQTGYVPVSSPEATALDLLRYARRIGGLDNVFTLLHELGERMDAGKLVKAAEADGVLALAQRLGWLLEKSGFDKLTPPLANWVGDKRPLPTRLDPAAPAIGVAQSKRWSLALNADVESEV